MANNNVTDLTNYERNSGINVSATYSYINNNMFYAMAPAPYYNYYFQFVRRFAWWYDRYDPTFHLADQGIFSTGIAHSLVDGISNLIVGSEVKLKVDKAIGDKDKSNESLKRAYEWADRVQFTSKLRNVVKYGDALGTSMLKINIKDGHTWLEAFRLDDCFFTTSFDDTLTEATFLIKSYTDTSSKALKEQRALGASNHDYRVDDDLSYKYYLVEHRFFKRELIKVTKIDSTTKKPYDTLENRNVPYAVYQVHRYNGSITNAQMWTPTLQSTLQWDNIPRHIRRMILEDYSFVKINEPIKLPFNEHLGCVKFKMNNGDGSLSQQPFGQSLLTDILSFCMGYDLQYSWFIRDLYQGKGLVFVSKELVTNIDNPSPYSGLNESMYVGVPSLSDKDNKLPIDKTQFELRVNEWREARNLIYESIATHLNISPSSIAGFLSDNTARTAKEVTTESTATDNFIEIQRGAITPYINELLRVVGEYEGWVDTIGIRWAKSGTNNMDTLIDRIIKLKQANLITQKEALKMYMVDADENEIVQADKELTAYNEQQAQMQADMQSRQFGLDMSYDTKIE